MKRRAFLATAGAGAFAGVAGCMGGSVVLSREKTIYVSPERGEIIKLPGKGEKIKYIARAEQRFSVYVFGNQQAVTQYRAYLDGESPDERPAGKSSLGGHAVRIDSDVYEVATEDRGRQSLDVSGSAYFVLDHSDYRGETTLDDDPERLSVKLDLEVIESSLPI